jgi:hypothetical protein
MILNHGHTNPGRQVPTVEPKFSTVILKIILGPGHEIASHHHSGTQSFEAAPGVLETLCRETGFSWHTFHFLIFYNFRRNDTEKKMVLVARIILRLRKKIY